MCSRTPSNEEGERPHIKQVPEQRLSRQDTEWSAAHYEGENSPIEGKASRALTSRSWVEVVRSEVVGWRAWVTGLGSLTLAVLILNSVLTGLAFHRRHKYPDDLGLATFYEGSCSDTNRINLVIKLGINILASCLLGSSNYCMQVLISPLREEVDRAHDKKQWLFVGMPNVKNLFFIHYKRRIVWIFLFLTSVALHLFWNAAVVHTIISNNYYVAGVSQDFVEGAPSYITPYNTQPWFVGQNQDLDNWLGRVRGGNVTILDTQDCLNAYTNNFVDEYSNLALVMNTTNATNSLLFAGAYVSEVLTHEGLGELWPCGVPAPHTRPCGFANIRLHNASHWTPLVTLAGTAFEQNDTYLASLSDTSVSYCLAESSESQCRLSAHPQILVIVLVCNIMKLVGIVVTWFYADLKDDKCITSGELIKSYIRRPDPRFYNRCLAGIDAIQKYPEKFWDTSKPWPMTWEKRRLRSWQGVPILIWLFYIIPAFCGTIAILGIFLGEHLQNTLYVGFGTPSLNSTLPWHDSVKVIKAALVANLPQLIASYIYVGCNAVLTGIWSQEELMHYSKAVVNVMNRDDHTRGGKQLSKRKQDAKYERDGPQALRVTQPQGGQRETYYLTLPWSTSIPLLLGSITLHWFVSEALFLLRVAVIDPDGVEQASKVITTVGYSSGAMLAVIMTVFVQLLTVMGIGWFKKYDPTMPLAGACSAAIAAISQPPVDENGHAHFEDGLDLGKLYWGVVGTSKASSGLVRIRRSGRSGNTPDGQISATKGKHEEENGPETNDKGFDHYQHATFSAQRVEPLIEGKVYA